MPTAAEVKEQLTGPGGPFEVVTEQVRRHRPMQVYKDRMKALRQIARSPSAEATTTVHRATATAVSLRATSSPTAYATSQGLQSFGVGHGDRVAVLSQNNPEWCLTFWGTVNIGAILVGLNGWWKTDEIVYGLQDSGSKILVADAKRFERIAGNLDECPDLEHVFLIDADPSDFGGDAAAPPLRRAARRRRRDGAPDVPIDEDDYAVIFYTSGTTGRPKGAICTHRNMIANLQNTHLRRRGRRDGSAAARCRRAHGQTVALFTSPLFHVSGCHSTPGGRAPRRPEARDDRGHVRARQTRST